jgi:hypothetical protein
VQDIRDLVWGQVHDSRGFGQLRNSCERLHLAYRTYIANALRDQDVRLHWVAGRRCSFLFDPKVAVDRAVAVDDLSSFIREVSKAGSADKVCRGRVLWCRYDHSFETLLEHLPSQAVGVTAPKRE